MTGRDAVGPRETPDLLVVTLTSPAHYSPRQLERALAIHAALDRGVLVLTEPPDPRHV